MTIDSLVFEEQERGPDEQLKLQFEAISHLSSDEKQVVKELLYGMIRSTGRGAGTPRAHHNRLAAKGEDYGADCQLAH